MTLRYEFLENELTMALNCGLKVLFHIFQLVSFMEGLFTSSWQVRFQYIGCLASVLSGLSLYHKDFAVAVVDNVIEDVRVGMEVCNSGHAESKNSK